MRTRQVVGKTMPRLVTAFRMCVPFLNWPPAATPAIVGIPRRGNRSQISAAAAILIGCGSIRGFRGGVECVESAVVAG